MRALKRLSSLKVIPCFEQQARLAKTVERGCIHSSSGLEGDPTQGIFSVFDGHGGGEVADFAAKHLHDEVLREVCKLKRGRELGSSRGDQAAMIRGFSRQTGIC